MKPLKIVKNISNEIFNGFLLVDKPKNMTSNDLCQILKKRYNIKSCGHIGTLDPDATGLMLLAFGRATKLLPHLDTSDKTYIVTVRFGIITDTLDLAGNIIKEELKEINKADIYEALDYLKQQKTQLPPLTSAIKVNGKKLLEYQRNNEEVQIKERNCHIIDLKILRDLYKEDKYYQIDLILKVTKGYYIRSFARDLGKQVNNLGVVKDLRRISIGSYTIDNSYPLETLLNAEISLIEITKFLKYAKIRVNERVSNFARNGVTLYDKNLFVESANIKQDLNRFIVYYNDEPIAIYEKRDGEYRPIFKF